MKLKSQAFQSGEIRIVQMRSEDKDLYYHIGFEKKDPEIDYYTGTTADFTREQIYDYFEKIIEDQERYDFLIYFGEKPIGEIVLSEIDYDTAKGHMRMAIFDTGNCGRGYGTLALMLLEDFAFSQLKLNRIELEVYSYNERAHKSYLKAGFKDEGRLREAVKMDGTFHDILIMSILKKEYKPLG